MIGGTKELLAGVIAVVSALLIPCPASAQGNPPAAPAGVLSDPVFQSAQKRYEALPESERRAIQEALMWTGDFSGAGSGLYGPLTFKAIQAFQKRANAPADGYLQPKERAALEGAADRARGDVRFTKVLDGKSAIRIGVPQAVLTKAAPGKTGTRYASADGAVTLDTMAQDDPDLAGLYSRLAADLPGRKVTYKVLRPDWFVIAADQDGKRSYTRWATAGGGLKGFVFSYPISGAANYDRMAVAIANSFEPVPAALEPGPAAAGTPSVVPPRVASAAAGPLATGIIVAAGKVLTTSAVEGCTDLSVAGKTARIERSDAARGLVLLDTPGLKASMPILGERPADGASLLVLGFGPAGSAGSTLSITSGDARLGPDSFRIVASLQRGGAGSPVFDRSGALVGIVASVPQQPRLVAGIVPEASYPVTSAPEMAHFAGLTPGASGGKPALSAADVAASAKGAVVAIGCGK